MLHNDGTTMKVLDLSKEQLAAAAAGFDEERTGVYTSALIATQGERAIALFFTGRQHAGENLADGSLTPPCSSWRGPPTMTCSTHRGSRCPDRVSGRSSPGFLLYSIWHGILGLHDEGHDMMKQAKRLWAVAALGMGLGLGFSAGAWPVAQAPATQGAVECVRNSDCDARCGEPGSGVCEFGRCVCAW